MLDASSARRAAAAELDSLAAAGELRFVLGEGGGRQPAFGAWVRQRCTPAAGWQRAGLYACGGPG